MSFRPAAHIVAIAIAIAAVEAPCVASAETDETGQSLPNPEPGEPRDLTLDADRAELAHLNDAIARDSAASKRWYFGWLTAFVTSGTMQIGILSLSDDPVFRTEATVNGLKSGVAIVASTVMMPRTLFASAASFEPGATPEQRAETLAERRGLLERSAARERFGRSFLSHLGGIALNGAGALYIWQKADAPVRAALGLALGITVGEIRIWTQPTTATSVVESYREARSRYRPTLRIAPVFPVSSSEGGGIMLLGTF